MKQEQLPTVQDLKRELDQFQERYPRLAPDELFILWFLRARVTDKEQEAAAALTGVAKDKGIDAILIDDAAKMVFII
jgi:hypothetical protein